MAPGRGRSPRIVVIEDDPALNSVLGDILQGEGFEVFCASRADEGLGLIQTLQPGCVLLDLHLASDSHVESGWRVLDGLVLNPNTRTIPVIVMSGSRASIEAHQPALLPQHGVRVLRKPFDLDELLQFVEDSRDAGRRAPAPDGS